VRVVILGASDKPDRYSYKAMKMLQEYGHEVVLVHPNLKSIEGIAVLGSLSQVTGEFDTLTMYVSPEVSSKLEADIKNKKPKRIIFNPGSENSVLQNQLKNENIEIVEGCTLVMLRTNQF
jgi:uncharacterized protein